MADKKTLLSIRNLKQYFPVKGKRGLFVRANDGVSLEIYENEVLGVVGESGCGKSTLGRTLLQLPKPTDGEAIYYGRELDEVAPKYALNIYHNLEKKCATTKAQMTAAEKRGEAFKALEERYNAATDKAPLKSEYFAKLNEFNEANKVANLEYLAVVRLIGGFYVANQSDYPAITKALEEDFYASREIKKINFARTKVATQVADHQYKIDKDLPGASQGKLGRANAKLDQLNSQLKESQGRKDKTTAAVESLRTKYSGDAEFQKYEAMRDSGIDLARLTYDEIRYLRRDLQLIFQDPYSSLNPRLTVGQIISEGPITHHNFLSNNDRMQEYTMQVMENCGLASYMIHRYPHQFSGGQRQRIGIARALSVSPKFVVCDEAVSALDVSIQSQIINLLKDLREKENLTYMFISHDLSVVKYISDRIAVMYLGNIVELCSSESLFEKPLHPYTEALLSAIPTTDLDSRDKEMVILEGDIPSPVNPPPGCKFNTRCRDCMEICLTVIPVLQEYEPGHFVACHKY